MASTRETNPRYDAIGLPAIEIFDVTGQPVLAAGEKVYQGTIAIIDAGKVKALPSSGTPTAGSVLLGIAKDTYDNSAAGAVDVLKKMCFLRGEFWIPAKLADPCAATELMKVAGYLGDNFTVQKTTPGANALVVKVVGVKTTETKVLIS